MELAKQRSLVECCWKDEWAKFEDASGRFYGLGKTGQNADSLNIKYQKIILFRPKKWAPAPPRDW